MILVTPGSLWCGGISGDGQPLAVRCVPGQPQGIEVQEDVPDLFLGEDANGEKGDLRK